VANIEWGVAKKRKTVAKSANLMAEKKIIIWENKAGRVAL
jgi:hypothetical protein